MDVDALVFGVVVLARLLLPLLIFRFPLVGILICLILDGIDQTVFQLFTDLELDNYQSYDKALDVYYLALAYIATMRNWVSRDAFAVSRALFYYRLVGVAAFELTGAEHRALLLLFPNTFEYFFIFYELVRTRWNPRRGSMSFWVYAAAAIWIFIKLPQEYWIHVAQLDVTDTIREYPVGALAVGLLAVVLALIAYRIVRPRVPEPDYALQLAAGPLPFGMDGLADRMRARAAGGVFSLALLEVIVLVGLVLTIFIQMMPGVEATLTQVMVSSAIIVLANTAVYVYTARRGWGIASAFWSFVVLLVFNVAFVTVVQWLQAASRDYALGVGLFFIALLTLIESTYSRYRPVIVVRLGEQPTRAKKSA